MISITIDEKVCIGCGLCESDCPNACIHVVDGVARVGESVCIECGHCYAICPVGAVTMDNYGVPIRILLKLRCDIHCVWVSEFGCLSCSDTAVQNSYNSYIRCGLERADSLC